MTRIILVKQNLNQVYAEVWGANNSPLFEITEGPHKGKRAPDFTLFDLVGKIRWDKSEFSDYDTGKIIKA